MFCFVAHWQISITIQWQKSIFLSGIIGASMPYLPKIYVDTPLGKLDWNASKVAYQ